MTRASSTIAWAAVVLATVAVAALWPYRLTDGDSCLYAAMGHDMARGGSWSAPQWDFHGAAACFHEHPPGAFWISALVERLGVRTANAALAANALWTLAAVAGVISLARLFVSKAAADFAGLAFLLHFGVMLYLQRAALEIPLAASAAWTLAAGLRLERSRWWIVAAAAALAAGFLVRGVFGAVPAALLVCAAIDKPLRPPLARLAGVSVLAAAALFAFDRAHFAATGHGFWRAYVDRQVLPSLQPGGTRHAVEGETWTFYVGRTLVYASPWILLPLVRLFRGPRPIPSPAAWRLATAWIVLTVAGASLSSREGSRYVFQTYVATSLLAALAVGPELKPATAWFASTFVLLVFPAQVVLKCAFPRHDDWWKTAQALEERRNDPSIAGREIRGPFKSEDDRMKSFLRFHLGNWTSSAPQEMRGLQWVPSAGADSPVGRVLVATPLGAIVDYDRR